MVLLFLLIILAYLALCYYVATLLKKVADLKGYDSSYHIFAIGFWLGIIGWMYVALLPDLVERRKKEELLEVQKKLSFGLNTDVVSAKSVLVEEDDELPPL